MAQPVAAMTTVAAVAALLALTACTSGQPVSSTANGGGATFEVASVRRWPLSGSLSVELVVRTTNAVIVDTAGATYLAGSGEQRQVTEAHGPSRIGPNSTARIGLTVPGALTGER